MYILLLFGPRTKCFLGPENEKLSSKTLNFVVPAHFKNVPPKITKPRFFGKISPKETLFLGKTTPCVALLNVIKTETLVRPCIYTPVIWSAYFLGPEN